MSARWRQLDLPARRPRYSALGSERGMLMPPLEDALARFVAQWPGCAAPVRQQCRA